MSKTLHLTLEACGCPTTCRHCWAQGGRYGMMPLADIERIVEQGQRFCAENGLAFNPFPMHELMAHPDAARLLALFNDLEEGRFEPFTTTGVPRGTPVDWRELLEAAQAIGTTTLWLAFHGVGEGHDRGVNRKGAFAETSLAVRRAHSLGMRCGCNAMLTKENVGAFDQYVQALQEIEMDEILWDVADYRPTPRGRRYETSRPEVSDLLSLVERIVETQAFGKEWWKELETHTEAAYVRQALETEDAGDPAWTQPDPEDNVQLVCLGKLDVHSGWAGYHGKFHGNLGRDEAAAVLGRGIAHGPVTYDDLCFSAADLPTVRELAERVGDPQGTKVYPRTGSMRLRWLDLALAAYRRY